MKELFEKLIAVGRADALESLESMKKAAAELGYTEEQIEKALSDVNGLPIDDDDLSEIAGGRARPSYRDPDPRDRPTPKG